MNAATAVAVALAVLSAGAYAAGAVAQQRTADPVRRDSDTATPARGFGWALAVGGNIVGALLHVLALRYGPLSVVQPLGALTLVFAVPLGALALGGRVRTGELLGGGLTVAGLGVLLALTPSGATTTALSLAELSALSAVVAAGVAAAVAGARRTARPAWRGSLLGVAAGIAFALSSVVTQTLTVQVAEYGWVAVLGPATVLLAAAAAAGVLLSQAAYRAGGLALPLTAVTLANPVAAAAIGLVLLGEGFTGGATGAAVAAVAAAVTMRGVLLLTVEPGSTGARTGAPRAVRPRPPLARRPSGSVRTAVPTAVPAAVSAPARHLVAARR